MTQKQLICDLLLQIKKAHNGFENTVLALFYCGCNQLKSLHICFRVQR